MAGDLQVLTADASGALSLGMPTPPRRVSGIDKLVQLVVLALLNVGGRSIFSPGKAGGLRALLGSNIDYDDPSELFADVRLVVSRLEQVIKEDQVLTTRPPSERLAAIQVVDIVPDVSNLEASIVLGVFNEEQKVAQAVVAIR